MRTHLWRGCPAAEGAGPRGSPAKRRRPARPARQPAIAWRRRAALRRTAGLRVAPLSGDKLQPVSSVLLRFGGAEFSSDGRCNRLAGLTACGLPTACGLWKPAVQLGSLCGAKRHPLSTCPLCADELWSFVAQYSWCGCEPSPTTHLHIDMPRRSIRAAGEASSLSRVYAMLQAHARRISCVLHGITVLGRPAAESVGVVSPTVSGKWEQQIGANVTRQEKRSMRQVRKNEDAS